MVEHLPSKSDALSSKKKGSNRKISISI
jgi:hypothetical protein